MPKSEGPDTTKADVESILAEFEAKEDMLAAFCARTRSLVEAILQDAGIQYQSVQTRVKSRYKLREKYLDPAKNYTKLDDITDLAGLRVITYYEDEVDRIADVIKREFDIDWDNSVDKRKGEPDRFGYNAVNYVCEHNQKRKEDVEYRKFGAVCCEIQITSILRHAWAEIEHEWYDLKDAYPDAIKRRFYLVAAMLELAEREFLDIRKSKTQYERSVAVQVEANVPDLPVDAVSLRTFIEQDPVINEIDGALASMLGGELSGDLRDSVVEQRVIDATFAGAKTLQDLRSLLRQYKPGILEFVTRCQKIWPSPTTATRPDPGFCIFHLGLLVTGGRGLEAAVELLKLHGAREPFSWDLNTQVEVARDIVAKYANK
jgi:putative GTP pyrophosphokinase